MELKFKNITKCSKEMYNEFLTFHNKKFAMKERLQLLFILFVIAYMIVFNIKFGNFKYLALISIILLICFFAYKVYRRETAPKREMKSSKIVNKDEIVYEFYNLYVNVSRNGNNGRLWYNKIYKIYQDNDNFYFYLDDTHALIMKKNTFVKGNLKDFKEFISKRCIFKYRKN